MTWVPLLETLDLTIGYRRPRHAPRIVAEGIEVALVPASSYACWDPTVEGNPHSIRTLSGMQQPLAGSVHVCGKPLSSLAPRTLAQHMSLVLTERAAVGMMPVATLVALGRHPYTAWTGRLDREDKKPCAGPWRMWESSCWRIDRSVS